MTSTTATTTATRLVTFDCGCTSQFTDHADGAWTWSDVEDVKVCDECTAWRAAERERAERAAADRAARKPVSDVEDWERVLLAAIDTDR